MLEQSPGSRSSRLNYISIELPLENWLKNGKFCLKSCPSSSINSSRPCSAQTFAIIHSSPQYQSSIKGQKPGNFFSKFSTSGLKDSENSKSEALKKVQLKFDLKRFDLKSEGSLRINSLRFEKPLKEKLKTPEVNPSETGLTFKGFEKELNRKIPNSLKVFLKNKSELKLKSRIIEIPQTDSPKIRRVVKGKLLKTQHRAVFMNGKKGIETKNLLVWGLKQRDKSVNTK